MDRFFHTPIITRRSLLGAAAAASALTVLHPYVARAQANQAHLRIMSTTDIHVAIHPYDYYADQADDKLGLSRTATIIDQIRAEAGNSILVDNGDFLQGNPLGDYFAYEKGLKDGAIHPVLKAMNLLGYDAGTLGNHEFNYGLDFLGQALAGANFPIVSANVARGMLAGNARQDDLLLKPYVILARTIRDGAGQVHPVRIGVIGFVPPQITVWDQQHLEGKVQTRDIVESARAFVPQMKEEGAEIIVALCHSGIDANGQTERMENAALYLAAIDGIDAVVTGHQHLVFPGPKTWDGLAGIDPAKGSLMGKPTVMAGFWGSHMGLIDLLIEKTDTGWNVVDFTSEARGIYHREDRKVIADVKDRQDILDSVKEDHEATLAYVRRPVGRSSAPLHSYFALVTDDPSVQIVNQAQLWYVAQLLKNTPHKDVPLLSAAAPFKSGGRGGPDYYTDVQAGDIAIKNCADLYLYPNTVRAVLITGADVKEWLEMSAGIFNQVKPYDKNVPLINPDFPSYNFDVIDGVTYEIDVSQPARYDKDGKLVNADSSRIKDLSFGGKPIDPAQTFVVATNNYRAGGGGNFPGINDSKVIIVAPDTNRDVLVRYIMQQGTVNPTADGNWRFAAMERTSAWFESGPKGRPLLANLTDVRIEDAGDGANGYARYLLVFS